MEFPLKHRLMIPGSIRRFLLVCCLTLVTLPAANTAAFAQKEFKIGPAPQWVKRMTPAEAATVPVDQVSQGVYYLLSDLQVRVEARTKIMYHHVAAKAVNEAGVEEIAHVQIGFDPSYETLMLHSINVRRGKRVMPKLKASAVRVLQREKELEYRIYDGGKTANVFLDDVRVGDIVEYAYTVSGANPVFGNLQFGRFDLQWTVPVNRFYGRLLWPAARKLYLSNHNTEIKPRTGKLNGYREYQWDVTNPPALLVEEDAPGWYDPYASVEWSEFKDWAAVARWALPFYRVPGRPGPAIEREVKRIAKTSADSRERLSAVLRFAQREIRYLGVEIGAGSHAPSRPQVVMERRFGDCKDKALLTTAMLRALGIEARPALVNTALGRGIVNLHPTPAAFNHVIVRVRLDGKDYWLDPTRPPQKGDLAHIYQPDYGYALVVDETTHALSPMGASSAVLNRTIHAVFDSRTGLTEPVLWTITSILEGASADAFRNSLASENREELQKRYLNFYAQYYPGLTIKAPFTVAEDEAANRVTVIEQYMVPGFWKRNEAKKRWEAGIYVPDVDDYLRQPRQTVRQSPLGIAHPVDLKCTMEVRLPEAWGIEPTRTAVEDPAFEFERTILEKDAVLTLKDHFRSRADHVAAEETGRYSANIDRARDAIGYVLYQNDTPPPLRATILDRINWSVTMAAFLLLLLWSWLGSRLYKYDPQPPAAPPDNQLQGIRGWLILPAIGVIAAPVRICADFIRTIPTFAADNWALLTTAGATAYHSMWAPVLLYELGANLAQIVFSLVLALLFFKKRRSAPSVYIGFLAGSTLLQAVDLLFVKAIPSAGQAGLKDWNTLAGGLLGIAVWSSYFLRSKRVKATFVNGYLD